MCSGHGSSSSEPDTIRDTCIDESTYRTLPSSEIQANCAKYGRLYTWAAAKAACQSIGWRLPTEQEWRSLVDFAGGIDAAGSKLKAGSGWNNNGGGTDNYRFSALPGGLRNAAGYFKYAGDVGAWWTASEYTECAGFFPRGGACGWVVTSDKGYAGGGENDSGNGFSVRCIKDD
ncbi:hypothetical protein R80B4_00389 [Fibrobacteres bacterium R8-0-B4]